MLKKYVVALAGFLLAVQAGGEASEQVVHEALATTMVQFSSAGEQRSFDGVIEAVRQTVVAAQISGAIVALDVKSGDVVRAGQVLMRIDARSVEQGAAAGNAQVQSARASLDIARKDFERQQQLFQKGFISQAGFDRAEAEFKAAQAQVEAQIAQAGVARTQSGFAVVTAPYGGVVSDVPVALGDMAMPGRPLLTLYDPSALRVTASLPESAIAGVGDAALHGGKNVSLEFPGSSAAALRKPVRTQVLPAVDPATHTVTVRFDLPGDLPDVRAGSGHAALAPGMFARVWLTADAQVDGAQAVAANAGAGHAQVPASAIVRRAEMSGVYVVDAQGKPQLRQVRLGRVDHANVEVLSGLNPGERVALDPQAAARVR